MINKKEDILIKNEENRQKRCLKYTKYRRNSVHAIHEKMTTCTGSYHWWIYPWSPTP